MRFRLRLDSRPDEPLYLILSLGRYDSPFEIDDQELRLSGVKVGEVEGIEDDDAVLGYWRGGGRMLTLNSNARSQCTGCVFCPNTLEDAADPKLRVQDLDTYFTALAAESGSRDLSAVETVTVCTGCFLYESLALEHLAEVRAAMAAHGCGGVLHFLSSVLATPDGLDSAAALGPFHLTLTAECFTRRPVLLKESKASLTTDAMVKVLGQAKDRGSPPTSPILLVSTTPTKRSSTWPGSSRSPPRSQDFRRTRPTTPSWPSTGRPGPTRSSGT